MPTRSPRVALRSLTRRGLRRHKRRLWVGGGTVLICATALSIGIELTVHAPQSPSRPLTASSWLLALSPNPGGESGLRSVVCPSTSACVGVGISGAQGLPKTLVETWDGGSWSVVPSAGAGVDSWLNAVSCTASSSCMAVGGFSPTGDSDDPADHTLAERDTQGTWSVVPSSTPGNGDQSDLQSVTCPLPSWCMAVGAYSPISNPYKADVHALAETWNGIAWKVLAVPSLAGGRQSALQSVACTSPNQCVAVGSSTDVINSGGGATHAFAVAWSGSAWSMIPSLSSTTGAPSDLRSVACVSPTACMAVGSSSSGNHGRVSDTIDTLVERWDGTTWSRLPESAAAQRRAECSPVRHLHVHLIVFCSWILRRRRAS